MLTSSKSCKSCGAWQPKEQVHGECRKKVPSISGWPTTSSTDWCCQWFKDQRPPSREPADTKRWQVGINYVFVRDYPELASAWLQAALAEPDLIPDELRPVLANPLGGVLTDFLPNWVDGAPCCERLLCLAEKLPGFCNVEAADDVDYCGLLMSMADDKEIAASLHALDQIPADHPWRKIVAAMKADQ